MTATGQSAQSWLPSTGESQLWMENVHVWRVAVEPLAGRVRSLAAFLSAGEQKRADAFVHARDRERFTVAHGVLRLLIGRYLDISPSSLQFSSEPLEKPHVESAIAGSDLTFNLSHSQGFVLMGFSRQREIGVDIEYMRPLPDMEQIAARTYSPCENDALQSLPVEERLMAFYRCWTRKEAFVKALGRGLSYPLESFSVSVLPESANCLLQIEGEPADTSPWTILGLEPAPGYTAALAVEGDGWQPTFWDYQSEEYGLSKKWGEMISRRYNRDSKKR